MKRMKLVVELEYDSESIHGNDSEAIEWFMSTILGADPASDGGLILHSNEVGDTVGTIKVLEVIRGENPR